MAEAQRPRYTPPRRSTNEHSRTAVVPRWILREAGPAFGLSPTELFTLITVVDNLDDVGVARLSVSLLAHRAGVARNTARAALDRLVAEHLIYELDPPAKGRMMRYAVAAEMPWPGRKT